MKLRHWASYRCWPGYKYTKRIGKTLGTVTATKLADYPIGEHSRRCVIRTVLNDDATGDGIFRLLEHQFSLNLDTIFTWLLDEGNRFTSKHIDKNNIVNHKRFVYYRTISPGIALIYKAVYEIDYEI